MATAKKTVAKKVAVKPTAVEPHPEYRMPQEVKDWIDQAMSRMRSMQNKIDKQAVEIAELKSYRKWAEHRILRSEHEE
jgi:hypothetical protein